MADLVEITFPSEEKAEQVRQKLLDMQREYLIELNDAVIAVKQPNGRVKLNQLFNPTASGAVSGTFWGALIGMIFLMPLAGAAIGAASGALGGALADVGINDRFMRDAAQSLQSGNAALFLLVRKMTTDKVLAALQGEGGTVIRTSFDESKEEALCTALGAVDRGRPRQLKRGNSSAISNAQRSKPNDGRSTANDLPTNTRDGAQAVGAGEPDDAVEASAGATEEEAGLVRPGLDRP